MGLGQSSKAPAADDTGEGELRSSFLFTHHRVKQGWWVKWRVKKKLGSLDFVITG